MAKVRRINDQEGGFAAVYFKCPGCKRSHHLYTQHTPPALVGPRWTFNDDFESPTLSPSILARGYQPSPEGERMMDAGEPLPSGMDRYPGADYVCHSFVRNGQIEFLGDCTHELAGQTVTLPDVDTQKELFDDE